MLHLSHHPLPAPVRAALAQMRTLTLDKRLWPGWDPLQIPLVLHGGEVAFLIGHPSAPPGYEPAGEAHGRPVFAGRPLPEMAANTARVVASHWCALAMLPAGPEADPAAYARLLLHEAFHVHHFTQLSQALPSPGMATMQTMGRYPENDAVNNALAVVENRLLSDALTGDDEPVLDFLAVRLLRHQRLSEELRAYEQLCEYSEGLAHYIEAHAGLPLADLAARLREASLGGKWAAWQRFYYSGAAQALLLDRLLPGWQERLMQGGQTLQSLLLSAAGEPMPDGAAVLAAAGYDELLLAEQEREAARRAEVDRLLHALYTGAGILVEVAVPPGGGLVFDPRNIQVLEPGVRLHTRMAGIRAPGGIEVQIDRLCLEQQGPHRLLVRLPEAPTVTSPAPFRLQAPGFLAAGPGGAATLAADDPSRLLVRFSAPAANLMNQ